MLIRENPRAGLIREAINRIRDAEKERAKKEQVERKRQYDEMLKSLTQFFGSDVQSPSDLYLEGLATRELRALKKERVLIYRDGNRDCGTAYLLDCEGRVVVANIIAGNLVITDEVLPLDKLAEELLAKKRDIAFDQVLRNVRRAVDALIASTDEDGTAFPVSAPLPKQTYHALSSQSPTIVRDR